MIVSCAVVSIPALSSDKIDFRCMQISMAANCNSSITQRTLTTEDDESRETEAHDEAVDGKALFQHQKSNV